MSNLILVALDPSQIRCGPTFRKVLDRISERERDRDRDRQRERVKDGGREGEILDKRFVLLGEGL